MESIYLTEGKGLTSSSASYLCNLAKEELKETEAKLKNLSFVNESVELINGDKKYLRYGCSVPEILEGYLQKIAEMHSFNAWFREGVKSKERAIAKIENLNVYDYINIKQLPTPATPTRGKLVTEQDIIDEMDIKTRNRYLELESFASTFGQAIHPDGEVAEARELLLERVQLPNRVSGNGRDMVIYNYTPSADVNKVNSVYLSLQNKYRQYEKELNSIKYSIKEAVNRRNLAINQKYQTEIQQYNNTMDELKNEMDIYVNKERERISNLKIVIPERLQKTYEYLESLGR